MWLLYSSWNVKLTAEKKACTTKSVQIINYTKAKSTLRHIYMIQMCVYDSILAGRLGDCWLVPGRLLAATAGCTRRLLAGHTGKVAGPWETAGCAEIAEFADFWCCCLAGEVRSWCWFFGCPHGAVGAESWCWFFSYPREFDWKRWSRRYEVFENWPVTQSSRHPNKKMPIWLTQFRCFSLKLFGIYASKRKFVQFQGCVSTSLTYIYKSTSRWVVIWW